MNSNHTGGLSIGFYLVTFTKKIFHNKQFALIVGSILTRKSQGYYRIVNSLRYSITSLSCLPFYLKVFQKLINLYSIFFSICKAFRIRENDLSLISKSSESAMNQKRSSLARIRDVSLAYKWVCSVSL